MIPRLTLALLLLQFVSSLPDPDAPWWSTKQLVEYHQRTKVSVHVQDVYKLLYQANFGVEHFLTDTAHVREYLLNELGSLETDAVVSDEPLVERISSRGDIVRVNLRPFKKLNRDPETLVEWMFRSAAVHSPDSLMFRRQWNEFHDLVRYGLLEFPMEEVSEWNRRITAGDIRPVHHSPEYAAANRPAYRVIHRSVIELEHGVVHETN